MLEGTGGGEEVKSASRACWKVLEEVKSVASESVGRYLKK